MKLQGLVIETGAYEETREFYARLLASQPEEVGGDEGRSATFRLPGGAPTLVVRESAPGAGKPAVSVGLQLASPDQEAARAAASKRGVALERQPDSSLQATDPAGNIVTVR